ncbi:TRAP transporter large permease subunit [Herbaspirillum sp. AP02]|uniref:TRAP transporter large permease n=1 Tax=unclassified Herbaspirillum TaxID=2624150 RepID=UPI0015DB6C33|nr:MULTISPECIES: TRAP transporter large permease subunit [unclassified Herbaspirillum]MBG7622007.1 TRAP transporter large permease subunit [Herbaspirillum sp. AP02]NZD69950.1 TRAP transporter large permease subunit [Herbaspirillum sp. AP21]
MSALSLEQPVTAERSLAARLEQWLGLAIEIPAAALVVGEVAVLLAGVVMRFIFNSPIPWADELASILFLWLANLGAVVALRRGTHMRTTVLVGYLSERGKAWAEALAIIAPCVMLLLLMHPMWEYAEDEMFVQTPALGWPNTVRAAAVAVGAALMIAISLLRISRQKLADLAGVLVVLAVVAGAMYLGAGWLQAIGNWNLVVFFGLVLGVSVLLGIPIAFCFGLATVAFMLTVTTSPLAVVAGRFDEGMSSLILLAVPLFILLGHLVEMTGMAKAMVDFLASLLGHVRGGLNYVLLGAMLLVSGISGAKTADMAAVAPVLLPEMKRRGNHEGELISLLAASGAMAETIPPSLVLITIGSVAGVSIAALFTGGIMPGIVLAVLLAMLARWRSAEIMEGIQRAPGKVVLRTLVIALPALLLPILIRTAVVEGVATATEVSTIGIAYSVVAGLLIYRKFDWKRLYPMLVDTAALSGAILFIIGTATGMSWALTQSGFSHALAEAMTSVPGGQYGFLLVSIAAFIVLGSVLEGIPAMVLFAPLLFPVAKAIGVHEVHYAMVIILSMGVGLFAPPFGLGYYAACTIGRVHPDVAVKRIWPYLGALVVGLLIVAFVPWFSIGFL